MRTCYSMWGGGWRDLWALPAFKAGNSIHYKQQKQRHWVVFCATQLISNNALWNTNTEMPNYLLITKLHTKVSLDHLEGKKSWHSNYLQSSGWHCCKCLNTAVKICHSIYSLWNFSSKVREAYTQVFMMYWLRQKRF